MRVHKSDDLFNNPSIQRRRYSRLKHAKAFKCRRRSKRFKVYSILLIRNGFGYITNTGNHLATVNEVIGYLIIKKLARRYLKTSINTSTRDVIK